MPGAPKLFAVDVTGQIPAKAEMIVVDSSAFDAALTARTLAKTGQRYWTIGGAAITLPDTALYTAEARQDVGARCLDKSEPRELPPEADGEMQAYRVTCFLCVNAETAEEAVAHTREALSGSRFELAAGGDPSNYQKNSEVDRLARGFIARVELGLEAPSPHKAVETVDAFLQGVRNHIANYRLLAVAPVVDAAPSANLAKENAQLKRALSVATGLIMEGEPGDSRAVSDVAVALASAMHGDMSPEVMEIIEREHERLQQPRDPEQRRPEPEIEVATDDTPRFEVLGYASQEDFDTRDFMPIAAGLEMRSDALDLARGQLEKFPIVKVQSNDRDFIQVLRREPATKPQERRRKPRP